MTSVNYDEYLKDCIDFFQRLIQTPSVNGKDNEKAVVELIAKEAEKLGLPYRIIEQEQGRPNIFIGEGFGSNENLLLVSHADTVPPGDESKWEYGPFSGAISEGRIFGRGAVDCKGGIAISLYVLKVLTDHGHAHLAKMLVGADEESGADSRFGIRAVLKEGLKAKGALYTYGGQMRGALTIGHRGVVRVWVTCNGESAHSGSLEWQEGTKGENAISGIQEFLAELHNVKIEGKNEYFPKYKTVITPTLFEGGSGESIVPSQAKVLVDIRTLPGDNAEVLNRIKVIAEKLQNGKRSYDIEIKNNIPAIVSDPKSHVVQEAAKLMGSHFGFDNPTLKGSGPANESYMLVESGIPTVVGFGPIGEGFHSSNEYAEIDSIRKSLQFMVELSQNLDGGLK